ncbi:MAG: methyltransferase domain-containing protein [Nitrospinae bacterium]|nr:methyltransferase domain-containing protein [Nitrospinota bacterium]
MRKEIQKKTSGYYRNEFNNIAWLYDPLIRALGYFVGGERRIRRRVLTLLNIQSGDKVLDAACGTGTSALIMAEMVGANGEVVGIDLSPKMIEIAKSKIKSPNISFLCANIEDISYPDNYFDKAHISLALHEMIHEGRVNTLREIHRVLKPSGIFVVADFGNPRGLFARFLFKILMLVETDTARDMMKRGLLNEIKDAGFIVEEVIILLGGIAQIIVAGKS